MICEIVPCELHTRLFQRLRGCTILILVPVLKLYALSTLIETGLDLMESATIGCHGHREILCFMRAGPVSSYCLNYLLIQGRRTRLFVFKLWQEYGSINFQSDLHLCGVPWIVDKGHILFVFKLWQECGSSV